MKCLYCGGVVEWQGMFSNLTHTMFLHCGAISSHVDESQIEDDEEDVENQ